MKDTKSGEPAYLAVYTTHREEEKNIASTRGTKELENKDPARKVMKAEVCELKKRTD